MQIADRDYNLRMYLLFVMVAAFLFAVTYFSIFSGSALTRASRSVSTDAASSLYSGDDADHTHSHRHGDIVHMHSHPSAAHHE